jgi:hypothetical protein
LPPCEMTRAASSCSFTRPCLAFFIRGAAMRDPAADGVTPRGPSGHALRPRPLRFGPGLRRCVQQLLYLILPTGAGAGTLCTIQMKMRAAVAVVLLLLAPAGPLNAAPQPSARLMTLRACAPTLTRGTKCMFSLLRNSLAPLSCHLLNTLTSARVDDASSIRGLSLTPHRCPFPPRSCPPAAPSAVRV